MYDFLVNLFSSDFMAHGYCYRWETNIVWLHAISDSIITLSYYVIPAVLVYLVRIRRDVPFHWMFFMFGIFIFGCGTTHLLEVWSIWNGTYRLTGLVKAITAGASAVTAALLVLLVPKAAALPSPQQLRAANRKLEEEIHERRRIEDELHETYDIVHAVVETVGALIIVIDLEGRIIRFNRASEIATGFMASQMMGKLVWDLFPVPEERARVESLFRQLCKGVSVGDHDASLKTRSETARLVSWSNTVLKDTRGAVTHVIVTGLDITDRRRLERAVLDIAAREQRRIGQDLHDDLGQRLTGIAFMTRVLQDNLQVRGLAEAESAAKVVQHVNDAIHRTRELSRGLAPVITESGGLMAALEFRAGEISRTFNIPCKFSCPEDVLVTDPEVAHHLYYFVQEAVSNAIKHAKPREITITLTPGRVSVADDGIGFEPELDARTGLGRYTMDHRARIVGGTFEIRSARGQGTTITCIFPAGTQVSESAAP